MNMMKVEGPPVALKCQSRGGGKSELSCSFWDCSGKNSSRRSRAAESPIHAWPTRNSVACSRLRLVRPGGEYLFLVASAAGDIEYTLKYTIRLARKVIFLIIILCFCYEIRTHDRNMTSVIIGCSSSCATLSGSFRGVDVRSMSRISLPLAPPWSPATKRRTANYLSSQGLGWGGSASSVRSHLETPDTHSRSHKQSVRTFTLV